MSLPTWTRLIRYVSARDNRIRWGEPVLAAPADAAPDIDGLAHRGGLQVEVLQGDSFLSAKPTGERDEVGRLLGPLTPEEVGIVRCIGLNYKTHIAETGHSAPQNPVVFFKPSTCIADTRSPTPIPPLGQNSCDYEGELTIVMGRDAKNVSPADALSYVAAYTVGNDVSCRDWQLQASKSGSQWGFSKSFDAYAPLGPCLVAAHTLGDAGGLELTTKVNGEVRQSSNTSDLLFGVRELVSFLSTGQTLKSGSAIMTGTPSGVGLGFKPPKYLKDGDEVEVEIQGIGKLVTTMRFE